MHTILERKKVVQMAIPYPLGASTIIQFLPMLFHWTILFQFLPSHVTRKLQANSLRYRVYLKNVLLQEQYLI